MVLQEFAQISQERQELQFLMHALQDHNNAVSKELATEKLQHGDTRQQLQKDNLHVVDELKVRLLVYDLVAYTVPHKTTLTAM